MRNKVLAVLSDYSEGSTIKAAVKKHGMGWQTFYKAVRADPELLKQYYERQEDRAEMAGDRLLELTGELLQPKPLPGEEVLVNPPDPRCAHVAGNLLVKIMETYKPARFSQKLNIVHEVKPNLVEAIGAGRSRAALPSRDLHPVIDVQAIDITPMLAPPATDMQSEAPEIDPFS